MQMGAQSAGGSSSSAARAGGQGQAAVLTATAQHSCCLPWLLSTTPPVPAQFTSQERVNPEGKRQRGDPNFAMAVAQKKPKGSKDNRRTILKAKKGFLQCPRHSSQDSAWL